MKPRPQALLGGHGNQCTLGVMHTHVSPMSAPVCDLNGVRHQVWWIFGSWTSPLESSFRKEKGNRIQKVTHQEELVNSLALGFKGRVYWSCGLRQRAAHTNPASFKWQRKPLKREKKPFLDGLTHTQGWELHCWESRKRWCAPLQRFGGSCD